MCKEQERVERERNGTIGGKSKQKYCGQTQNAKRGKRWKSRKMKEHIVF